MEAFNKVQPKKIKLSDYEMDRTLGSGSFGRVKLSKNKKDGNYVAIKILKKCELIKLKQVDHILNEIKILSMIDHPFLVHTDGFTQDKKYLYVVLELVNGGELFTYLRGVGKFPPKYMYTFLNEKYGLKNLIIDWARNIINGIKYYSKKDSFVLLFGKIMRNEQEEDARLIIQKVLESIEELLLYYIKRQNPLKSIIEIKRIFERKKNSELYEEEWKGIIYSIYEKKEADEIEKKINNFISKENEKRKIEMFKQ